MHPLPPHADFALSQEYKAERALASLRSLSSPTTNVVREGQVSEISARDLVVGDIVLFSVGDLLSADVRIVSLTNLEIDEAPLTGESVPVLKTLDSIHDVSGTIAPADRINLGFAGTTVTKGRGKGVVVATAMSTQIGLIAEAMNKGKQKQLVGPDGMPLSFGRRLWEPCAKFLGLRDGTPLQRKLAMFALILFGLAILCALIVSCTHLRCPQRQLTFTSQVFSVAEFRLDDDVVLYAIALGIGVLPESLVAVLTITFSVGAKRMAQSNVVVRKLDALEALGGTTDICSDKTGTLTHGKMIVRKVWVPHSSGGAQLYGIEQGGSSVLEPEGRLWIEEQMSIDAEQHFIAKSELPQSVDLLATAASLCNIAEVFQSDDGSWASRGDPTEVALQVFSQKLGFHRSTLLDGPLATYKLEQEHPFDSHKKRMTMMFSLNETGQEDNRVLFMKGAPERVLACCSTYRPHGSELNDQPATFLDQAAQEEILDKMETLASAGLRVLAFACRKVDIITIKNARLNNQKASFNATDSTSSIPSKTFDESVVDARQELAPGQMARDEAEQDFEFIGFCGLYDPPRAETLASVRACQDAGIIVHMLTGDHISTARAIAREVGIVDGTEGRQAVMAAADFDAMSDQQIDALEYLPLVVARCSPSTKVRMIAAGKRRGRYLAMTGDGVNDAPALRQAPIGIAMGSGTDVAKDSAELILTDDRFDSIAKAVKEGRTVFKNIQRFMIALLVLNVAEVLLLLIGLALRDANEESLFPISPIGILFLNLVAGLPAIGLGFEGAEPDVMARPPHDLQAGVLSRQVVTDLFVYGTTMGWTSLVVFLVMIYGLGQGVLGSDCNELGRACNAVFEARSATFTTLFLQGLFITWELISIEHSFFTIRPVQRLRQNPFLLLSVLFGVACIPICVYVPVWNTEVFRQGNLGGPGWGIAIAANVIFLATVELWKWLARRGGSKWLTRISGGEVSTAASSPATEKSHA